MVEEKGTGKWDVLQPANGFGDPDCCITKEASGIYFTYWGKGESCGLGTCFWSLQCTIIAFGLYPSAAQNPDGSWVALNQDGCHFTSHCECTTWSTGLHVAFLFKQRLMPWGRFHLARKKGGKPFLVPQSASHSVYNQLWFTKTSSLRASSWVQGI